MQDIQNKSTVDLEYAREAHERWLIKNNRQDLNTAIEYYSKTIINNPDIAESYYRLAMLLWENGQISLSTAIDKCRSALTFAPENIDARLYTGYFLKLAENYSAAEREFKKAVDISPLFSSRARLNLGLLHAEKFSKTKFNIGSLLKASYYIATGALVSIFDYSYVRMSIQKSRESFEVGKYIITGGILKLFGLDKKAVKNYKNACSKTGRLEIFGKLIGDIDIKYENVEQALDSYDKALKVNPVDREALLKKATILQTYFKDRNSEAIDTYNKALETKGDKDYIYYELGHLYLSEGEIFNSINAFKLAVEENSTNAFFHNALGFALFRAGQYEEAEDHYLLAINLNPDPEWTATVCRAVALIYSDIQHNNEKAVRMYRQSLSFDGNCADTYTALGDLAFEEEDYNLALEYYAKSIELNHNDAVVYNKLATTLWQKDFIEEAIIAYKNAIDINPSYSPAYNNLGVAYLDGKNMFFEAKDCFESAIENDKEYTMAYYNAGRTYESFGDKVHAAKMFHKALELNKIRHEIKDIDIEDKIHSLFEV